MPISDETKNATQAAINEVSKDVMDELRITARETGEDTGREVANKSRFGKIPFVGNLGSYGGKKQALKEFDRMAPNVDAKVKQVGSAMLTEYAETFDLTPQEISGLKDEMKASTLEILTPEVEQSVRDRKPTTMLWKLADPNNQGVKAELAKKLETSVMEKLGGPGGFIEQKVVDLAQNNPEKLAQIMKDRPELVNAQTIGAVMKDPVALEKVMENDTARTALLGNAEVRGMVLKDPVLLTKILENDTVRPLLLGDEAMLTAIEKEPGAMQAALASPKVQMEIANHPDLAVTLARHPKLVEGMADSPALAVFTGDEKIMDAVLADPVARKNVLANTKIVVQIAGNADALKQIAEKDPQAITDIANNKAQVQALVKDAAALQNLSENKTVLSAVLKNTNALDAIAADPKALEAVLDNDALRTQVLGDKESRQAMMQAILKNGTIGTVMANGHSGEIVTALAKNNELGPLVSGPGGASLVTGMIAGNPDLLKEPAIKAMLPELLKDEKIVQAIAKDPNALAAIANHPDARKKVLESKEAMNAIAKDPVALEAALKNDTLRKEVLGNKEYTKTMMAAVMANGTMDVAMKNPDVVQGMLAGGGIKEMLGALGSPKDIAEMIGQNPSMLDAPMVKLALPELMKDAKLRDAILNDPEAFEAVIGNPDAMKLALKDKTVVAAVLRDNAKIDAVLRHPDAVGEILENDTARTQLLNHPQAMAHITEQAMKNPQLRKALVAEMLEHPEALKEIDASHPKLAGELFDQAVKAHPLVNLLPPGVLPVAKNQILAGGLEGVLKASQALDANDIGGLANQANLPGIANLGEAGELLEGLLGGARKTGQVPGGLGNAGGLGNFAALMPVFTALAPMLSGLMGGGSKNGQEQSPSSLMDLLALAAGQNNTSELPADYRKKLQAELDKPEPKDPKVTEKNKNARADDNEPVAEGTSMTKGEYRKAMRVAAGFSDESETKEPNPETKTEKGTRKRIVPKEELGVSDMSPDNKYSMAPDYAYFEKSKKEREANNPESVTVEAPDALAKAQFLLAGAPRTDGKTVSTDDLATTIGVVLKDGKVMPVGASKDEPGSVKAYLAEKLGEGPVTAQKLADFMNANPSEGRDSLGDRMSQVADQVKTIQSSFKQRTARNEEQETTKTAESNDVKKDARGNGMDDIDPEVRARQNQAEREQREAKYERERQKSQNPDAEKEPVKDNAYYYEKLKTEPRSQYPTEMFGKDDARANGLTGPAVQQPNPGYSTRQQEEYVAKIFSVAGGGITFDKMVQQASTDVRNVIKDRDDLYSERPDARANPNAKGMENARLPKPTNTELTGDMESTITRGGGPLEVVSGLTGGFVKPTGGGRSMR